jgi:tryptophan halogenase
MRSLLLGETLGVPYEDWSEWLHCDSAVAAQTTLVGEAVPYTRSIAHPWGWQWRIPLQHRVGNGLVYSSKHLSDDEAKSALLANVQGDVIRPPRVIKFTPGQREVVWKRNCVAIGLSSGFLEPLESTSIHLIQRGLTRLIQMFPANGICQSDIDEYNNQTRSAIETIRDFIILHYHVNNRNDVQFWRDCREMAVPKLLAHRIQLFRDTARVCLGADELFADNSWIQVMMGQGITPTGHHPVTRLMDSRDLSEFLGEIRKDAARNLMKLPKHQEYVAHFCGTAKPADIGPANTNQPPGPAIKAAPMLLNPNPNVQTIHLANGRQVYVIDDFVQNPETLMSLAQSVSNQFHVPAGHPYPGPQLLLPPDMASQLEAYFEQHIRLRLAAGPSLGMYGRFSRVTQDSATLNAVQRICHTDDSNVEPGNMISALVHYLFQDEKLGGTVLFRSLMSDEETQKFLRDATSMEGTAFGDKYGIPSGYMTQSNRYFEVIGRVPAKWNRAVFYDGSIFHSGDIQWSSPSGYQAGMGRLTVNAFFKSKRTA